MIHVDTNILVDILSASARWAERSEAALRAALEAGAAIGPLVYAELAVGIEEQSVLDQALREMGLVRLAMPDDALFLAGRAFAAYRARGGRRTTILPDYFVGAHAAAAGAALLTRDPKRYRTAFPDLRVIEP